LEPACFLAEAAVRVAPAVPELDVFPDEVAAQVVLVVPEQGDSQVAPEVPVEPVGLAPGGFPVGLPELAAEVLPGEWLRGSEPEPVLPSAAVLELDESRPNVMGVQDARLDGIHSLVVQCSSDVPVQVGLHSSVLIPERAWRQVWFRAGSRRPVAGWFPVGFRWVWQQAGSAATHSSVGRYSERLVCCSEPVFRSQAWSRSGSPVLRRGLARHA